MSDLINQRTVLDSVAIFEFWVGEIVFLVMVMITFAGVSDKLSAVATRSCPSQGKSQRNKSLKSRKADIKHLLNGKSSGFLNAFPYWNGPSPHPSLDASKSPQFIPVCTALFPSEIYSKKFLLKDLHHMLHRQLTASQTSQYYQPEGRQIWILIKHTLLRLWCNLAPEWFRLQKTCQSFIPIVGVHRLYLPKKWKANIMWTCSYLT